MGRKKHKKKQSGQKRLKQQLAQKILDLFKRNNRKLYNYKQIAGELGITDSPTRKLINEILNELVSAHLLEETERGRYRANAPSIEVTGLVDAVRSGGAFIITDSVEQDIYVAPPNLMNALHGDMVRISLFTRSRRRRPEGEVLEVLDQDKRQFVGTVEINNKFALLSPDSDRIKVSIYIPLDQLKGAKHGHKAIATITDWPRGSTGPSGKIVEVLGEPGETGTEMHAILAEYGLPRGFPKEVEDAAAKIPLELDKAEIARRRDMRDVLTFTIDPLTAQDFDDALSMQKLENGNWEIGIHIADVSHYVRPNDMIDKEALARATSVYLVDRVVPMLPEVLSNKVCSLRPNEDKFTFSAVFELNEKAKIINEWFGRTATHSDRRFTYEEAQERLETGKGDLHAELKVLNDLAKLLRAKRMEKGSIEFSSSEVRFQLDDKGKPIGVTQKVAKDSNRLIEDFMLLANRRVAKFVGNPANRKEKPKVFVYRVHDKPNMEKLEVLARFMQQFEYKLNIHGDVQTELNKMLKEFADSNERQMIEQVAIRSMAKAVYTIENIGHYGLGFEYYTHFTSPIRRYPDLLVHRLLQRYLDGGTSADDVPLEKFCKHSSIQEKKAADAERSSIKFMQVLYMMDKIGQEFEGTITGVTEWGMYVALDETKCEGMVSIKAMDNDFYYFDEAHLKIVGRTFGAQYRIGDSIKIVVKDANLHKKQLDFGLVVDE